MFEKVNKPVALLGIVLLILSSALIIIMPEKSAEVISEMFDFITGELAWFFMALGLVCGIFGVYVAFSKYGDIRIGGANAKPHYSRFKWVSMIICSALAVGILIFGTVEWMYYVHGTPFGLEPQSVRAYEFASAYGLFHWGPLAWAFYLIPAFAVAYMYWNKKADALLISDFCDGVLGDKSKNKFFRLLIDGTIAFCFVGGMASTVGLGTPVIAELFASLMGIDNSFVLQLLVLAAFGTLLLLAASKTIAKGMGAISSFNVKLGIALFVYVFLVGPKSFILNNYVMSLGTNIDSFFRMATFTDAIGKTGFVQSWTIFYWAWYVELAISVGIWIARISYGRTLREIIITTCVLTPLASQITYGILGNYGMNLELTGQLELSSRIGELGNNGATLAILKTLPLSGVVIVVFLILLFFNLATTVTAHATSVSILTSKGLRGNDEPNASYKTMWGLLFLLIPLAVLILEKNVPGLNILKTLQSLTVVFAIPVFIIAAVLSVSAYKVFKKDISEGNIPVDDDRLHKWGHNNIVKNN